MRDVLARERPEPVAPQAEIDPGAGAARQVDDRAGQRLVERGEPTMSMLPLYSLTRTLPFTAVWLWSMAVCSICRSGLHQ